jgi:hypothetical protein
MMTSYLPQVYGRFRPNDDEFRKWEAVAAAQDAERQRAG